MSVVVVVKKQGRFEDVSIMAIVIIVRVSNPIGLLNSSGSSSACYYIDRQVAMYPRFNLSYSVVLESIQTHLPEYLFSIAFFRSGLPPPFYFYYYLFFSPC